MKVNNRWLLAGLISLALFSGAAQARQQWSKQEANDWYQQQPWLLGANFTPSTAANQIEMWHKDTFDIATIDKEMGMAADIGMNTLRVFLHNLVWENDREGFNERLEKFLELGDKHNLKVLFVLFDSDWDPNPVYGQQKPPVPGVHNSRWVQAPGEQRLQDKSKYPKLKEYVQDVIGNHANDERVIGWDLWNEPSNTSAGLYDSIADKNDYVALLLPQVYDWARSVDPKQPLTTGLWSGAQWDDPDQLDEIEKIQVNESDIISFHDYGWPEEFEARVQQLSSYGRPLIATEYMARGSGSTFDGTLPMGKKHNVGMFNWGLVDGKTQTRLPWDSWYNPYTEREPTIWFHEIFHSDGTPYRQAEIDLIKSLSTTNE
ncbi:MAG TPA: hypothetical protein VK082_04645 [Paenalcaligenes sp.]|nr:hypothetical protein [Paenalcaligenes sp.]